MNDQHSPLYKKNPDSKGLVIFIHGFMGSPRHFDGLAELAYEHGCSVSSLLLPGHGRSAKEFAACSAEQWQGYVDSEISRFSAEHDSIFLVGHSMGGLLALNAAARFGGSPAASVSGGPVSGAYVLAAPFELAMLTANSMRSRTRMAFSRERKQIGATYKLGNSVRPSPYLLTHIARPYKELKKLMRGTRELLGDIRVPVTAAYSPRDELVSFESLSILEHALDGVCLSKVALSDSLHDYAPEHERRLIEQALLASLM